MNQSVPLSVSNSSGKWGLITAYLLCIIGGNVIQSLILIVVTRSKRMQSTTNYFIISLSLQAIVFLIVVGICLIILEFPTSAIGSQIICRGGIMVLLSCIACNQSILAATSIDRYNAVASPIDQRYNFTNIKFSIAVCIVISIVSSCPSAIYMSYTQTNSYTTCQSITEYPYPLILKIHLSIYIFLFYGTAFFIVFVSYIGAVFLVWRVSHNSAAIKSLMIRRTLNYLPKAKIQVLKILLVITLVDILIMTTLFAVLIIVIVSQWKNYLLPISVLYFISSTQKPIVYFRMHRSFRQGCRETMCCCQSRTERTQNYRVTKILYWEKRNWVNFHGNENDNIPANQSTVSIFTINNL